MSLADEAVRNRLPAFYVMSKNGSRFDMRGLLSAILKIPVVFVPACRYLGNSKTSRVVRSRPRRQHLCQFNLLAPELRSRIATSEFTSIQVLHDPEALACQYFKNLTVEMKSADKRSLYRLL